MNEELENQINELIDQRLAELGLSSLSVPYHQHTLTDAGQLDASKSLIAAPQAAITTDSGGTAGTTYTTTEQGIINNTHQRINDIYKGLQNLGLFK